MIQRCQNSNGLTLIHGDPNPGNILAPKIVQARSTSLTASPSTGH